MIDYVVQQSLNALSFGAEYALIALGLAIVFLGCITFVKAVSGEPEPEPIDPAQKVPGGGGSPAPAGGEPPPEGEEEPADNEQ